MRIIFALKAIFWTILYWLIKLSLFFFLIKLYVVSPTRYSFITFCLAQYYSNLSLYSHTPHTQRYDKANRDSFNNCMVLWYMKTFFIQIRGFNTYWISGTVCMYTNFLFTLFEYSHFHAIYYFVYITFPLNIWWGLCWRWDRISIILKAHCIDFHWRSKYSSVNWT